MAFILGWFYMLTVKPLNPHFPAYLMNVALLAFSGAILGWIVFALWQTKQTRPFIIGGFVVNSISFTIFAFVIAQLAD